MAFIIRLLGAVLGLSFTSSGFPISASYAAMIIDDAKEYLANGIASIYALLDPEIIILGGSVSIKMPHFVEDVEARVKEKVFSVVKPYVKVVRTTLNEDSGLIGAACLAFLKERGQ